MATVISGVGSDGRGLLLAVLSILLCASCGQAPTEPSAGAMGDSSPPHRSGAGDAVPSDAAYGEPSTTPDSAGDEGPEADADRVAEADAWDCSLGPHCVDARTREYCVDGVLERHPCPDGEACAERSGDCEPIICDPSNTRCVDETTLERCVDHGTAVEELPCESRCESDACVGGCIEGEIRCVDDRLYEICSDGVLIEQRCPEDELGTSCFDDGCRTACERAELESDYAGCVFWAVDLDNIVDPFGAGPGAEGVAVVVANISEHPAQIQIDAAGDTRVDSDRIEPGDLETYSLFPRDLIGTRIEAAAYRITSSLPVLAYQFNPLNREGTSSTDASLLLPESALGERYRILSYPAQGSNQRGFATVVGVGDESTTVSLTARGQTVAGVDYRSPGLPLEHHVVPALAPGETLTRILQPFDVWQVETSWTADLTGSLVVADGPVAVFGGTRCSNVPAGVPNCDHLEHQMLPVSTWDRNFVATPGPVRDGETTTFRVVADFAWTFVETAPPVPGTPATLGPGDALTFEVSAATAIHATEPILVGQYLASAEAGAGGFGDPSFTVIPPVEQFRDDYILFVPDSYEMDAITLIRNEAADPSPVRLDDVDLSDAFADLFTPVGETGYEVAQVIVDDGIHRLASEGPVGVLVAGYDDDVSYAYPGGLHLFKPYGTSPDASAGRCADGGWLGAPCDTGAQGRCLRGTTFCAPDSICLPALDAIDERCNGIDDDCDGAVDEGDACSDGLEIYFVQPGPPLVELVEGDTQEFRVAAASTGPEPVEIAWYIDSAEEPVAHGETLVWHVLPFEAGVHRVWVVAAAGSDRAHYEWLVHIHDVPTNFPTLYGRTFDLDGDVFVGAPITVAQPGTLDEPVPGAPSVSDFRGFYALNLAAGVHDLMIHADSPLPEGLPPGRRVVDTAWLLDGDARHDVELPVAHMWGVVYGPDAEGVLQPIPGAFLSTWPGSREVCADCRQYRETAADGSYELPLFTGEHFFTVQTPALAYPSRSFAISIERDTRRDIYLDSPPPSGETVELTATVTDPCSAGPVAGVQVRLVRDGYVAFAYSDEDGRVTLMVPPGPYEAFVYTGRSTVTVPPVGKGLASVGFVVAPSLPEDDVRLEVPNAFVSGTVRPEGDAAGLGNVELLFRGECSNCRVSAVSSAEPSEEGAYQVYLLDSAYQVEITPPPESGWANFTAPRESPPYLVQSCSERLDLLLRPPVHQIQGTITAIRRDDGGEVVSTPVDDLDLDLRGPTHAETTTAADGGFQFLVVPGEYEIRLPWSALGYGSSFPGDLPDGELVVWYSGETLASSDPDTPVALELRPLELPLTLVSGRVTNIEGGGLGLEGVELRWIHQGPLCNRCEETAVTGSEGYYEVLLYRAIPTDSGDFRGRYRVEVDPGEYFPPQVFDDVLVEGRESTFDVAVGE